MTLLRLVGDAQVFRLHIQNRECGYPNLALVPQVNLVLGWEHLAAYARVYGWAPVMRGSSKK
ncbi:Mycobacterium rhizamassiliense ORFan [Mycobacterium rhizamassiliense]|uniref:Mycobacterium rhizamassiliense ORFan n=1 Tax=Mycobacterium rhizamassiliense TaxID=1841860 RepID=A0A2U3NS82_9MYCO|nr:Mycobacterium rhizamassiliense ORFan [Mycobacterium rhizamassiliense]